MYKNLFLSLFLHSIFIFILISNLNFWQNNKKITYQKFSVKISSKISNKPTENKQNKEILKNSNTPSQITKNMEEKVTTKDHEKKEILKKPDDDSKNNNEIKSKINKDTKKSTPKNAPAIKNIEKSIQKTNEIKSKINKDTKKSPPKNAPAIKNTKKSIQKTNTPKQDIFSKLDISTDSLKISDSPAELNNKDSLAIKEQITQYWIKTPCTPEMEVSITLWIDYNCNIIHRESTNINSGYQYKACLESCLNATHKSSPLNLDPKSCKKYANKAILLNFSP